MLSPPSVVHLPAPLHEEPPPHVWRGLPFGVFSHLTSERLSQGLLGNLRLSSFCMRKVQQGAIPGVTWFLRQSPPASIANY